VDNEVNIVSTKGKARTNIGGRSGRNFIQADDGTKISSRGGSNVNGILEGPTQLKVRGWTY
jgi:hypothetical protein